MEIGLTEGLAQDFQADKRIEDSRRRFAMLQDAKQIGAARAKMLADDAEYQNVMNPYDNARIKTYANQTIEELGKYTSENPDWETDRDKRIIYNQIKRKLKDNPYLNQGLATKDQMDSFEKSLTEDSKNPHGYNKKAYEAYQQQIENYNRYGNQGGEIAAKNDGPRPFKFMRPTEYVDLADELMKSGSGIQNYEVVQPKGAPPGAFYTKAKDQDVEAAAMAKYREHKEQIDETARANGIDPLEFTRRQVIAGTKTSHSMGDVDYNLKLAQLGMERERLNLAKQAEHDKYAPKAGGAYTTFKDFMLHPTGTISDKQFRDTWGTKPKIKVTSNRGDKVIDLTGEDFRAYGHYNVGDMHRDKNAFKVIAGHVDLPLKRAEELGIYNDSVLFGDGDINKEYDNNAKVVTVNNKDGKPVKIVRVVAGFVPDKTDQNSESLFNNAAQMVTKHIPAPQSPFNEVPTYSATDLKANGWNDELIQKAVSEGRINVK